MLSFPNITNPSELSQDIFDATVITRRKTTKQPLTFTLKWSVLKNDEYNTLLNFYRTVQGSQTFTWIHPISKVTYNVKFTSFGKSEFVQPYFWKLEISFKEI